MKLTQLQVRTILKVHKDQRIGQFLYNVFFGLDIFNLSDKEFIKKLEDYQHINKKQ